MNMRLELPIIATSSVSEAIRILYESLCNTMTALATVNEELETLKREVERLKSAS